MTYNANLVGARLQVFVQRWAREHPPWAFSSGAWAKPATAAELAAQLLADAEFAQIGLASWLSGPDGRLVRAVVGSALPPPQRAEVELLADAIVLAADAQHCGARFQAAAFSMVAVMMIVLLGYGATRARSSG
jgi:hypothetical protein